MSFWNRPHKHYWTATNVNAVKDTSGQGHVAEVRTYQCFGCGSIRYDKVDCNGLVSTKITDDKGKITNTETTT
jgi:hypothetical protein